MEMDIEEDEIINSVIESRTQRGSLIDIVFSWSVRDILNKDLYKQKVKKIPMTFLSMEHYLTSFIPPLIEETHADLSSGIAAVSKSPFCQIIIKKLDQSLILMRDIDQLDLTNQILLYKVTYMLSDTDRNIGSYEPEVGDLIALSDVRPKCIDDLCKGSSPYLIALILKKSKTGEIQLMASKPIVFEKDVKTRKVFCAVFLINMTTNIRIWQALNIYPGNKSIIKNMLQANSSAGEDNYHIENLLKKFKRMFVSQSKYLPSSFNLNESQESAVLSCIAARVDSSSENSIKLIWGPPGTGKTKTVGSLLFALFKLKCRTLTCAPTNIAVLAVATRLLSLVKSSLRYDTYGLGDIVLFGNKKRMKVDEHDDLEDIFLDTRVRILVKCFAPLTGWKGSLDKMLHFLQNLEIPYLSYLHEIRMLRKNIDIEKKKEKDKDKNQGKYKETFDVMTIEEFSMKRFDSRFEQLKFCIVNLYKHLPTSLIKNHVVENMIEALDVLKSIGKLLHSLVPEEGFVKFKNDLSAKAHYNANENSLETLTMNSRKECTEILETLPTTFKLPNIEDCYVVDSYMMKKICSAYSCIVLCTASSSAKLHFVGMMPLDLLVIDEAAQLKECESAIPLQLPGIRHAVLIGDERQLPALVKSKICEKAEFGRSLFERMVILGHKKHLLNVQYRMHPSISWFPNNQFYNNQISDAPSVKLGSYQRHFLDGKMFGTYSFINIAYGKEDFGHGHSSKNMVEVAVVSEIVETLFKESVTKKQKVSVGIISPYKAQVFAIQEKLSKSYDDTYFSVSARSVDGFQGGEEDVIIMSTVRCNGNGSIGFLSNHQRTNVALTRARYCLWILGNEPTLSNSGSIWSKLVTDAKNRNCYFNAEEDTRLGQAITTSLLELNRLEILLNTDSPLFKNTKWKVNFSDDFCKTMKNTKNIDTRKDVFTLVQKLSTGWRQAHKKYSDIKIICETSQISIEQYEVNEFLCLVWTIDVVHENSGYIQVLKVWDMLPSHQISSLVKRLESSFEDYTVKHMNRCKFKSAEGNLEVPMRWPKKLNGDDGKSSLHEAVLEQFMSRPLGSLRIRDDDCQT